VEIAQTTSKLHRDGNRLYQVPNHLKVLHLAGKRSVKINDVQQWGPCRHPTLGYDHGIVTINRLLIRSSL
jgi:hypothetical protein